MQENQNQQKSFFGKTEGILIIVMWMLMLSAPVLFQNDLENLSLASILKPLQTMIPLFIIFLINRFALVPLLLFKNKMWAYLASVFTLILLFTFSLFVFQNQMGRPNGPLFEGQEQRRMPPPNFDKGQHQPPPMQDEAHRPVPPFANFLIFSILIIGFDTGLKASFKWAKSEREKKELERENIANQLDMLRHQVSPHFFMNTLNNIHTLIDIDGEDAKDAVMKLSKMMRYLLYETAQDTTTLAKEIDFIESYVELMKLRISEKVDVQVNLPQEIPNKSLPPLLFTSFIENAFKHSVSYQKECFIHIQMRVDENKLLLQIKNSKGPKKADLEASGIGLENVKKRLELLFGSNYQLDIFESAEEYSIHLSIPL